MALNGKCTGSMQGNLNRSSLPGIHYLVILKEVILKEVGKGGAVLTSEEGATFKLTSRSTKVSSMLSTGAVYSHARIFISRVSFFWGVGERAFAPWILSASLGI